MVSICIPIYNHDVRPLVNSLIVQVGRVGGGCDIWLLDDGSDVAFLAINRELAHMDGVHYHELPKNVGRSAVRNKLGQMAQNDFLLFIDCDVEVADNFIENYLNCLSPHKVLSGGYCYPQKPASKRSMLRWRVGVHKEASSAIQRNITPYRSFLSGNFLIPRHLFLSNPFDESIRQYGYEDTLFGIRLQQRSIEVEHIDNTILIIDIDTNAVYIEKTNRAISNLAQMMKKYNPNELANLIKIVDFYQGMPIWSKWLVAWAFRVSKPLLVFLLNRSNPSLIVFDFYKLGYLCHQMGH